MAINETREAVLLILDIDETLLHSAEHPLERAPDFRVGPYYVYRRPYLDNFLKFCQQYFTLAVWSSSGSDYLNAIVHEVFPKEIELAFVWSRDRCVQRIEPETWTSYFVKDLKKVKRIGYSLNQVLIVDDSPEKVERNYGNAIYVRPFVGQDQDDELRALAVYLHSLRSIRDVRSVEKRDWRTSEAVQIVRRWQSNKEPPAERDPKEIR